MNSLLLLAFFPAQALADAELPSRPTTFMVDDRLSDGTIENFRSIHIGEEALLAALGEAPPERRVIVEETKITITDRIYFDFNEARIQTRSYSLLDEVAATIAANPHIEAIQIDGHTDNVGNDESNMALSLARANAVRAYLVARGVDSTHLATQGHGESSPIDSNDNEEGRANNRRVEFHILDFSGSEEPTDDEAEDTQEADTAVTAEVVVPNSAPPAILPIINDSSSWAEVVVNDIAVGMMGPLTNGAIHGVPAGSYRVQLTIMNGYTFTRDIGTVSSLNPIAPGGEGARPALEDGTVPTWHPADD